MGETEGQIKEGRLNKEKGGRKEGSAVFFFCFFAVFYHENREMKVCNSNKQKQKEDKQERRSQLEALWRAHDNNEKKKEL